MSEHQAQGSIRHFRTRKELDSKLCPAIVSGIVIGNALVSYWPMFSLSLVTVPEVFAWHSFLPVSKVTNWQSFLINKVFCEEKCQPAQSKNFAAWSCFK